MARSAGWPYKKEFVCHRCGNCCRGDGFVEMTESDVARAAQHLEMPEDEFLRLYTKRAGEEVILLDQNDDEQSCIFLTQDQNGLYGCRIHAVKPAQCAGFPFHWRSRDAIQFCEGLRALEGLPTARRRRMSPSDEANIKS